MPVPFVPLQMAANRGDNFKAAVKKTWNRGGITGFYQGLFPWVSLCGNPSKQVRVVLTRLISRLQALIEASTKGAILLYSSNAAFDFACHNLQLNAGIAGALGGVVGGLAQAYVCMGFTTCMKTVEVTRSKLAAQGVTPPSTFTVFRDIIKREGIAGVNRGVNAVAARQVTGWASRMGIARVNEGLIRAATGKSKDAKLSPMQKILASCGGGALSCWNQPFEVIRVEMQSKKPDPNRPANMTVASCARYIYQSNGVLGFFRGITPRICLAASATTFMVALNDIVRASV